MAGRSSRSRACRPAIRAAAARARRLRPPTRAGRAHRAGRTERGGEDHGDEPPAPVPRPAPGARDDVLDGRDLRALAQEDVRGTFALAGQDAHVFDSSIRENLRLARPDATDGELVAALRSARLDEWVASLPAGLDTLVGEEGAQLSGGQRQRLVIARALLADAPVLVLDEPNAHLDSDTAEALVRDVLAEAGDRTVLLITHRPEGLDLVDEVVTLPRVSSRPRCGSAARR